jgi:hypothetical protein
MRQSTTPLLLAFRVAVLVLLTPLASATPVDPLWIPGIYDEADYDDVICIVVDDQLAIQHPDRMVDGIVTTTEQIATRGGPLAQDKRHFDTPRLRSPPNL